MNLSHIWHTKKLARTLQIVCTVALVSSLFPTVSWIKPANAISLDAERPTASASPRISAQDPRIQSAVATMSTRDKIGQVLWTHVYGSSATEVTDSQAQKNADVFGAGITTPKQAIETWHLGGVAYFNWSENVESPGQLSTLSADLQQAAALVGIPGLAITIDQEGGLVARVRDGVTDFPGAMALGATHSPDLAYEQGSILGTELAQMGITMDFAPVVDVNTNAANPVIGVRSLGDDPTRVGELVAQQIAGLQANGVSASAKHFPGHGDTSTDSHTGLPHVTYDWQTFQTHLTPFKAAIAEGVDSIMTAHIVVEAVDSHEPATMSPAVLTDLLRGDLDYQGLIITDALDMEGAQLAAMSANEQATYADLKRAQTTAGQADLTDPTAQDQYKQATEGLKSFLFPIRGRIAARALEAGADVLLNVYDVPAVFAGVEQALSTGELAQEKLDTHVANVLAYKVNRGLAELNSTDGITTVSFPTDSTLAHATLDLQSASVDNLEEHQAVADTIAERSITLLSNGPSGTSSTRPAAQPVLPINSTQQPRVLVVGPATTNPQILADSLSNLGISATALPYAKTQPTDQEITDALALAPDYDYVIDLTYKMTAESAQANLASNLIKTDIPTILVSTNTPYDTLALSADTSPAAALATYSTRPVALRALARVLVGEVNPTGTLPVFVSDDLPRGFGLSYTKDLSLNQTLSESNDVAQSEHTNAKAQVTAKTEDTLPLEVGVCMLAAIIAVLIARKHLSYQSRL